MAIGNQPHVLEESMSTPALFTHLHHRWGWFLALGIILIVLGIIALVYTPAAGARLVVSLSSADRH